MHVSRTHTARGFSLVELLIAMTIGLVLISGIVTVFAGNKRNAELNTATTVMQEGGRFALQALTQDARMSGYQGCLDINRGEVAIHSSSPPTNDLRASATSGSVVSSSTVWSPAPPLNFVLPATNPSIPGTHALAVQFAGSKAGRLTTQMADSEGVVGAAGDITIDTDLELDAGDLAVIANCDAADLFTVSNAVVTTSEEGVTTSVLSHAESHNSSDSLTWAYGDDRTNAQTTVMPFQSNVYYVGDTGLTNRHGDRITALYQQSYPFNDASNPPLELITGVENMRIAFGIREVNGNLRFVPPDNAAYDSTRVEAVKIGLLLTSVERVSEQADASTYVLAGQDIAPLATSTDGLTHLPDNRFRMAFNTTVKIRNRRNSM